MSNPSVNFLFRAWKFPDLFEYYLLIGIGIIYAFASYFITQAYRISRASNIAPFEYAALPLSILWSVIVFNEFPDFVSWIGILLIVFSCHKHIKQLKHGHIDFTKSYIFSSRTNQLDNFSFLICYP